MNSLSRAYAMVLILNRISINHPLISVHEGREIIGKLALLNMSVQIGPLFRMNFIIIKTFE
jgi:hypothetical protein